MASLPVNDEIHKELKIECVENSYKMKKVVNRLVEGYLEDDFKVMDD